jgi:hypothetical protein
MFWIAATIKKAKEFWSWLNFIWQILGWLGIASLVSGMGITAIGIAGAVIKGLPWPIILMAGYCTLVGVVYLAMAPLAFKALSAALQKNDNSSANQSKVIRPHYDAWRHVEKFTLRQAAYLWVDLEPKASGQATTKVQVWIEAFRAAIRQGNLKYIPKNRATLTLPELNGSILGRTLRSVALILPLLLSSTIIHVNF